MHMRKILGWAVLLLDVSIGFKKHEPNDREKFDKCNNRKGTHIIGGMFWKKLNCAHLFWYYAVSHIQFMHWETSTCKGQIVRQVPGPSSRRCNPDV